MLKRSLIMAVFMVITGKNKRILKSSLLTLGAFAIVSLLKRTTETKAMITTTSLLHPSMQIKIKSCRVQAMIGLVGKVYNRKGQVIMVAVVHGEVFNEPTFYAVYEDGSVGKDVTDMVLKACPYPTPVVKKTFFNKCVDKAVSVYENVITNSVGYVAGITLVTASFS